MIIKPTRSQILAIVRQGVRTAGLPWRRNSGGSGLPPTCSIAVTSTSNGTVMVGGTLTATVTGTPTPTVQWYRNGVAIGGATATTYTPVAADINPSITCIANNGVGTATSNALAYTYAADTTILDGWIGSQLSGTAWNGVKGLGSGTASSASHITASTINGVASVHGDGSGWVTITGLGTALSGQSGCSVFSVLVDSTTALAAAWEYVSTSNMNMTVNDSGGAGNAELLPNATYWSSWTDALSSAAYYGFHFDRTVLGGIAAVRKNASAQSLTGRGAAPGTPGGNFASGNLTLFNRTDHAIGWTGDIGDFVLTTSALSPTGNPALTIEASQKNRYGL